MKAWFNSIIELIKNNKLTVLYIILGIIVVFLILVSIFVAIGNKDKFIASYEDKGDFVHKVLKNNSTVKYQVTTILSFGLFIAAIILFCFKLVIACACVLAAYIIIETLRIIFKLGDRYNRVEYNNAEIYKFGFMQKTRVMRWEDVDQVKAGGFGPSRKLLFIAKNNMRINVSLNVPGAYDFTVFAESKLDGKNFEAIRIAKSRR